MHKFELKNFHVSFYYELINTIKKHNIPYIHKKYLKDDVIVLSQSKCQAMGIIQKGEIKIEHLMSNGNKQIITTLKEYDVFGEILLFSEAPYYPYDIITTTNCEIFMITKENLLKIFKEDISILGKFLSHISQSYIRLNRLIKLLSQKTLKHKLAYYFLDFENLTKGNNTCKIKNKTTLASLLGVERQSLIRELNNLRDLGKLFYVRNEITIIDVDYFDSLVE